MSRLAKKSTSAVSAEGLEGKRARLQQQGEVVENHGREGAERPRLKIKGTPIHYLLARRATAQLESQRLWRSKGDLNARSAPKRHE